MNDIFPLRTPFVPVPMSELSPQDTCCLVSGYHPEGDLEILDAPFGDTAWVVSLSHLGGRASRQLPSGGRLALVAIPSFSDAFNGDPQATLEAVSGLLTDLYHRGIRITRVLHLHDMSQKRISAAMQIDLGVLQGILGPGFYPKLVFAGTDWASDSSTVLHGEKREKELAEGLWKPFIEGGARIVRFASPNWRELVSGQGDGGVSTQGLQDAETVLDDLVIEFGGSNPDVLVLQLLDELVRLQLPLAATSAGRVLFRE